MDEVFLRAVLGWVIIAVMIALYFLPSIVGYKKVNFGAIFVLNMFLGWTGIGWIGALIWALTVDDHRIRKDY
jgi:hypothetical protein